MTYPPQPPAPAPNPNPAPAPAPAPPAPQPAPAPPQPAPAPAPAPAAPPVDRGFPDHTTLAEMTDAQQAAYWKFHARQHEHALRDANVTELQQKAAEYDRLRAATQSDQERAIEAARAEGRTLALRENASALVAAHFAAALPTMPEQDRQELLAGIDRNYFLAADGVNVDTAKVTAYAARIAPAATATAPAQPPAMGAQRPDLGQGRYAPTARPSGLEAGRAEAQRRFGKPAPPPAA